MHTAHLYILFFGGVFFVLYFLFLYGVFSGIKFPENVQIKKIIFLFNRFVGKVSERIKYLRDLFCIRIMEEGLINGLIVNGVKKFVVYFGNFSEILPNGNINFYLTVAIAMVLVCIVLL